MKKLVSLISLVALTFTLYACQDYAANSVECKPETDVETETGNEGNSEASGSASVFTVKHINGGRDETDSPVYVLFEYPTLKYTKYQVSYLSCTWRPPVNNYKQVAYIELDKAGTIKFLSYDVDSSGHYTPAVWGDSSPTPAGKMKEDFVTELINGYFIGKTVEDLANMYTIDDMTDFEQADSYAGSSVTVNNMLRMLKGLQEYHLSK